MNTLTWFIAPMPGSTIFLDEFQSLRRIFMSQFTQSMRLDEHALSFTSGYRAFFSHKFGENYINPETFEGAGEITKQSGHLPLLFFAALSQRLEQADPELSGRISFSSEEGTVVRLHDWPSLRDECDRLDLSSDTALDTIRHDAELIELIDPVFRFDRCDGVPSSFF